MDFETLLEHEYARILRLCIYWSQDTLIGQDLAQETMLEAWRNRHKLVDPTGGDKWLTVIARHVYQRWLSRQDAPTDPLDLDALADPNSVEIDLEKHELADLLDRALALLPAETRTALVERYMKETPLAEIASLIGANTGKTAVHIHRGRLVLEQVFRDQFQQEAASFNLWQSSGWQPTPIWCIECGQHYLECQLNPAAGRFLLRCPGCFAKNGMLFNDTNNLPQVLGGIKGIKPAYKRLMKWSQGYYLPALQAGHALCTQCQQPITPSWHTPSQRIDTSCAHCGCHNSHCVTGLVIGLPEGQAFWQANPRLRLLPITPLADVEGQAALHVTYESLTTAQRFDAVFAYDAARFVHVEVR